MEQVRKIMSGQVLEGNIVDVVREKVFAGKLVIDEGKIVEVKKIKNTRKSCFIIPGLVDAHVHVESSMLTPVEFGRIALKHGTTQCVSDPHEIANVMGKRGVRFMIDNAKKSPLKITFGVPSCVPATQFENTGSIIDAKQVKEILGWKGIGYLSEVMNFPGVIAREKEVMKKIMAAKEKGYVVDGHAPGLRGKDLESYVMAGITTDHECSRWDEAIEKIKKGMKIIIRQGSAAKNLEELVRLADLYPEQIMFCTDDIHPDDLVRGHMNQIYREAVSMGAEPLRILRCLTVNPMNHYNLEEALLKEQNTADLLVVRGLKELEVLQTYIDGNLVYEKGKQISEKRVNGTHPNIFRAKNINSEDLVIPAKGKNLRIIEAKAGTLYTGSRIVKAKIEDNMVKPDVDQDVLKIVVLNRYALSSPALGMIRGFGLKTGALAGSIAHDSHNIICVGVNDDDMSRAINYLIENKGGLVISEKEKIQGLKLPVAGIMTNERGENVARHYRELSEKVKSMGSSLEAPFMTLSFMALPVIPELKMTDRGLFDVGEFSFTSLFV